ncbi:MAG: hypothetical protein MZV64_02855 [Ignavibacteriales bacterium]|nr:hypothetical protein [Ignavibacteriales bacterium]
MAKFQRDFVNKIVDMGKSIKIENSDDCWQLIRNKLDDPLVKKEVWIVLGRILSRDKIISELKKDNPIAEALQCAILLQGVYASVGHIKADLKIFCY